jgi:hypothetical protein
VEVGLPVMATGVDRGGFGHDEEDYRCARILRSQDRMGVVGGGFKVLPACRSPPSVQVHGFLFAAV